MVSDLVADAGRIVLAPAPSDHWQFAGHAIARALAGLPPRRGRGDLPRGVVAARRAPARLPRLAAVLEAPARARRAAQRVLRHARAEGAVPRRWTSRTAETFGVGEITEFTWKDLFDTLQLHRVRPLHLALPGQHERQGARPEDAHPAPAGAHHGGGARARRRRQERRAGGSSGGHGGALVGDVIHDNVLWACTTCRWCVDACPVFIEHVPKIVGHAALPRAHRVALPRGAAAGLPQHGDATATRGRCRGRRAPTGPPTSASAPMSDVREAEYLYWVGCYGSFDERNKKVARAFVKLLQAAAGRLRHPRQRGALHGRAGAAAGPRVPLPDPGPGQRRDAQAVPVPDHRHGLSALLQHDQERVPGLRRPLPRHPSQPAPRRSRGLGAAACRAGSDGPHHLPRRLQPRPLQRRVRRAAARPGLVDAGTDRRDGAVARRAGSAAAAAAVGC